jgi:hypothetical protein
VALFLFEFTPNQGQTPHFSAAMFLIMIFAAVAEPLAKRHAIRETCRRCNGSE